MALGAKSSDVFRQVVVNGMKMTLGGVFVGGLLAAGLTEFLASLLYGVTSRDPLTFGASGTLLVLITLAASIPPAWRAVRISPIEA
jgi:ABC-type antimicrobial peptide transport system permease subunit